MDLLNTKVMKRKDFLKRLGIGLGVAIVAPKVLAETPGKEEVPTNGLNITTDKWSDVYRNDYRIVSDMYDEILSRDMVNLWRQTGQVVYKPRRISTNIRVSDVFGDTL